MFCGGTTNHPNINCPVGHPDAHPASGAACSPEAAAGVLALALVLALGLTLALALVIAAFGPRRGARGSPRRRRPR